VKNDILKRLARVELHFYDDTLYGAIGLLGVVLYVSAYAALQLGLVAGQTYRYSVLNLAAASCVLFSLIADFNLSSALIQAFWIALSVVGISRLRWIAAKVKLTTEEADFVQNKFPALSKSAARKFLDSGCWVDAPAGDKLIIEDQPVTELVYLANGEAEASFKGKRVGVCPEGALIGEVTCLTGAPATASVTTTTPSRYFCIGTGRVRQLYRQNLEIRSALDSAFATDTGLKLKEANRSSDTRAFEHAAE